MTGPHSQSLVGAHGDTHTAQWATSSAPAALSLNLFSLCAGSGLAALFSLSC